VPEPAAADAEQGLPSPGSQDQADRSPQPGPTAARKRPGTKGQPQNEAKDPESARKRPGPAPPRAGTGPPALIGPAAGQPPVPAAAASADAPTAQTILASFIDWDRASGGQLTRRTIGQLAKQIADLLAQGIGDRPIRRGLAGWRASAQHPSTLDSFVNAAMKGGAPTACGRASPNGQRPSTTNAAAQQAIDAGRRVQAMFEGGPVTPEETGQLLAICASFDRRTVGEADVIAWLKVLGDLPLRDCEAAVIAHYRDSRDWIMPADVRQRVKATRRERLDRHPVPAPPAEIADQPGRFLGALRAGIKAVAGSIDLRCAIGGPVRDGEPPAKYQQARAALPPGRSPKREHPSLQENAREQVAESRAARAAAETLQEESDAS
jgi:hypothetical protein